MLSAFFKHLGSEYRKTKDAVRIAQHMRTEEIAPEMKQLLKEAISLPG